MSLFKRKPAMEDVLKDNARRALEELKRATAENSYYEMHAAIYQLGENIRHAGPEAEFALLGAVETAAKSNMREGMSMAEFAVQYTYRDPALRSLMSDKALELATRADRTDADHLLGLEHLARTLSEDGNLTARQSVRATKLWQDAVETLSARPGYLGKAFNMAADAAGNGYDPALHKTAIETWDKIWNDLAAHSPKEAARVAEEYGLYKNQSGPYRDTFRQHVRTQWNGLKLR